MTAVPQTRSIAAPAVSPLLVRSLALLERSTVSLLVFAIVGFGVWTLVYQAALAADLGSTVTLAVAVPLAVVVWLIVSPAFLADASSPGTAGWGTGE